MKCCGAVTRMRRFLSPSRWLLQLLVGGAWGGGVEIILRNLQRRLEEKESVIVSDESCLSIPLSSPIAVSSTQLVTTRLSTNTVHLRGVGTSWCWLLSWYNLQLNFSGSSQRSRVESQVRMRCAPSQASCSVMLLGGGNDRWQRIVRALLPHYQQLAVATPSPSLVSTSLNDISIVVPEILVESDRCTWDNYFITSYPASTKNEELDDTLTSHEPSSTLRSGTAQYNSQLVSVANQRALQFLSRGIQT